MNPLWFFLFLLRSSKYLGGCLVDGSLVIVGGDCAVSLPDVGLDVVQAVAGGKGRRRGLLVVVQPTFGGSVIALVVNWTNDEAIRAIAAGGAALSVDGFGWRRGVRRSFALSVVEATAGRRRRDCLQPGAIGHRDQSPARHG